MAEEETRPLTREEWRKRVQSEGRMETIRKEMIRLGFWNDAQLSPEEKQQQALEDEEYERLQKELNKLKMESAKLSNLKQLLKEARKKRIEESKRKRAERKAQREKEKAEAKKRWQEYKETHVIHAGEGVSGGLQNTEYEEAKLRKNGLPVIGSALQLAEEMNIPLQRLKWLTYHRNTATLCHYHRFTIPKRSGGKREISAPKRSLRQAQEWVKHQLLDRLPIHPAACGFVPGKSTLVNARQHLGQSVVVKMDLKDFFPSITFRRVKGLFQSSFGYSESVSTLLALLCTEPPRKEVEFDGTYYYVAMGDRQLPQGACTSPTLTNILCRRLDRRLQGLASKFGFQYSRYADDLTFSCSKHDAEKLGGLINGARSIIQSEGFKTNEKKTRILRDTNRQTVTGIVVNQKPNIRRKELRRFRALLHRVEINGLNEENRDNHPNFWEYISGTAGYIRMVRPDLEARLASSLIGIGEKYNLHIPPWCKQATVADR
ncbi:reverse transcriptase family protein [Melghirimyces algeriensis]|uniref:RNA-directed DNA polymerase n=1 Tax=Melghirimyces algeriensis TaxID=910412 RepID=A0A521CUD8_9BACL|nr:reverse transcriptase family protein [Melghirimyces algeriensis]SMO63032.1 RNA-directed DNA polymerase [Melghirimyces algeriensis]